MPPPERQLLIVEDDLGLQKQLRWCFDGHEVHLACDRAEALKLLRRFEPPVVLQDLGLPPDAEGVSEGMATLQEILRMAPRTKVIVVTGNGDRDNALRSIALGACDFYSKPVDTDVLKLMVDRAFHISALESEVARLQAAQSASPQDGIIATDPAMLKVVRMIEKVAPTGARVLILGESGTGKELVARSIHRHSDRSAARFVAINCAAIPEQLLESELFGHEKGAFTGAVKQTIGKIETAQGGTLFLDEIGDMPLSLQAKLLRFLQDRVIERVGGRHEVPVDVRVLCATNQDLQGMITTQRFRQDLYFRISEVTISLPPLRARPADAVILAQHLLQAAVLDNPRAPRSFSEDALAAMQRYEWPGNVRELENKVRSAVIMGNGPQICADDLGLGAGTGRFSLLNLKAVRSAAEKQAVQQALAVASGNVSTAAEMLGITRPTLYDLIAKFDLQDKSGQ